MSCSDNNVTTRSNGYIILIILYILLAIILGRNFIY